MRACRKTPVPRLRGARTAPGGVLVGSDSSAIGASCGLARHSPGHLLARAGVYRQALSEDQIQRWVDEAEAGYDVDILKPRGRGRPGRGAEPMQVVAVRLTAEELDALNAAAAKLDMSRSEAIRAAVARFAV